MATFKTLSSRDIKTTTSVLNQLVDFVEEDISGSNTRKTYDVFVTGSGNNSITSSLYHTVYDQNYTLQTANELFDITIGLHAESGIVTGSSFITSSDISGKMLFTSQSLMMREKVNNYKQFANLLLGDSNAKFTSPFSNPASDGSDVIDSALFLTFKRLFVRDGIKRETFAMKLFQSSSAGHATDAHPENISITAINPSTGSIILTDVGSGVARERSVLGGDVGNIVNAANTSENMGLLFYQQGIVILDMEKVFNPSQVMTGSVSSVGSVASTPVSASFNDFLVSGSIDDVVNHISSTRFGSGSYTTLTFQNNTKINSTLVFCRATADEFNYSSNPTYVDSDGKIRVIDNGSEGTQKAFSFVTTIGLYDANEELLAVAKLSRPVEKNDEKDLTFRVRLDF
jgi:hypothetical protein